ncbi:MAG TPA: NAD(P)-dependent oxidoreductase [Kofleriaceae bacterium]
MPGTILITGSEGLVGTGLDELLTQRGERVVPFDLRASKRGDICDADALAKAVRGCRGIVHLAAVSRVVWGQREPALCWRTNAEGTRNVLDAAAASPDRPWVIYASSREVYGQPDELPVREHAPLRPVNIYGRSKAAGEEWVDVARSAGVRASVVRLSNVYGTTSDHADRVVPAFAAAAARGESLRVEGSANTFDFTHLDDTVRGLASLIELLDVEAPPPPIHFVTGRPTTLGELARAAVSIAGSRSPLVEAPPRSFDVARFWGDPRRAEQLLGWRARVTLEQGLTRLIEDFAAETRFADSLCASLA